MTLDSFEPWSDAFVAVEKDSDVIGGDGQTFHVLGVGPYMGKAFSKPRDGAIPESVSIELYRWLVYCVYDD